MQKNEMQEYKSIKKTAQTTHVQYAKDKYIYIYIVSPSPLDLSVVAAGERCKNSGTGEQRAQPTSGQPGPHPGGPR